MKKAFVVFSALALVLALAMPLVGGAQVSPGPSPEGCTLRVEMRLPQGTAADMVLAPGTVVGPNVDTVPNVSYGGDDWAVVCMLHTVTYVTNWIFYIIIIVVGIMILYAAFIYLTAGGDAEKPKTANRMIVFAIIGLVLALLARAIPAAVRYIIGF